MKLLEFDAPHLLGALPQRLSDALRRAAFDPAAFEDCSQEQLAQWRRLVLGSEYAALYYAEHPAALLQQLQRPVLPDWRERLAALTASEFDAGLRRLRREVLAGVIWCELNQTAAPALIWRTWSEFAEDAIGAAVSHHYRMLSDTQGAPMQAGQPLPFWVLGMGKLGGGELNLSSDIDLIFVCGASGEHQAFFNKLGQRVIQSLDAPLAGGQVFRVDMRLRPFGASGPLVASLAALADYYQYHGREWERFAMIKARVVATTHPGRAEALEQLINAFTYRRYLDYSALDALRHLKSLIEREVRRKGRSTNVKLGAGGIREVEFVAQALQLIRGGRDRQLQTQSLFTALERLIAAKIMPAAEGAGLRQSYILLRRVEHGLQALNDRQTQDLPKTEPELERLALALGFADWPNLAAALEAARGLVHTEFQALIAAPATAATASKIEPAAAALWFAALTSATDLPERAAALPLTEPTAVAEALAALAAEPSVQGADTTGRERLDQCLGKLLTALKGRADSAEVLRRLVPLLAAVARRSAYLLLLNENPAALARLIQLAAASPWIAASLAATPALLDELLAPFDLSQLPRQPELAADLSRALLRVPTDDLEAQLEALRYFRAAHALRVAGLEVNGDLPLMKVSDYLSALAEVILAEVLQLAWAELTARHGQPPEVLEGGAPPFAIIAYGKLGGLELGHGSDLDLVFIHGGDPTAVTCATERPLELGTFYVRLGQKIIHYLSTRTAGGRLYEVDLRLRPSGNSGLLVTTLNAFAKYQREQAWTWEHQALVRARFVGGDPALGAAFDAVRREVLSRPRELTQVRAEVVEMRHKMRAQLGSKPGAVREGLFNLKQDPGGIVDIEFMVQYAVLAHCHAHPELADYTDNIRILERMAGAGILDAQEARLLIEAYQAFRSIGHELALQQQPAVIDGSRVQTLRSQVSNLWQALLGDAH